MNDVILYGVPFSSYVRTALMTCAEKGVKPELVVQPPGSPQQLEVHPFGKVPAMKHGDVHLFETSAICRYIDQAFDGPALVPAKAADAAVMEQWLSSVNCYLYGNMVVKYALQYILPGFRGEEPDRAAIDAGVAGMTSSVEMIDKGYEGKDWLAGDAISLADLFIAPVVQTIDMFPEGKKAMSGCANLKRVYAAMQERDSFKVAHPAPE